MDVFSAFPNAIIKDTWQLGIVERATEVGDKYTPIGFVDVIIDEVASGQLDKTPDANGLDSDTLVYCRPEQLPGFNISRLISSYCFYDTANEQYYEIRHVGVGKNQNSGRIEHVEFQLRAKEMIDDGE